MPKTSELDATLQELRVAAQSLTNAADSLTALFSKSTAEPSESAPPTLEQVRAVLADKSRNGHTEAIRTLLEKYGGSRLSEISPNRYAEILEDAEGLT